MSKQIKIYESMARGGCQFLLSDYLSISLSLSIYIYIYIYICMYVCVCVCVCVQVSFKRTKPHQDLRIVTLVLTLYGPHLHRNLY